MNLTDQVRLEINRMVKKLQEKQTEDGSWHFCFESGPMTDAYMVILLRTLDIDEESLIKQLVERISYKQQDNGTWKLFRDEEDGNLSSTIEAYYALLFSGYFNKSDENMKRAKQFILSNGGIDQAHSLTKVMLSLTGQYPWEKHVQLPIELILLPPTLPVSFYDFVGYARVHLAPIMITSNQQYSIVTSRTPNLSDLYVDRIATSRSHIYRSYEQFQQYRSLIDTISHLIQNLAYLPETIQTLAYKRTEEYILKRIEPDGTLYSYASATFIMVFALLVLGYSKHDPVIVNAIQGLKSLTCRTNEHIHLQNSTSTVWDTALLSYALQESGVPASSSMIQKANRYILSRQHSRYGDWSIRNPHVKPGGWGFSNINTMNPDVDDTAAALRAISYLAAEDAKVLDAWNRGLHWELSMQNDDGGWPAFEKNTDNDFLAMLPYTGSDRFIDPSSADLTGRTLEFLGNYTNLNIHDSRIQRGIQWLLEHQEKDGSWYGRWGVSYIYGTWAAITGMKATEVSSNHPSIQKAVQWLEGIQNTDGGWGESCKSDILKQYVPLGSSTLSQTAWAVDTLLAVYKEPTPSIIRGIRFLIEAGQKHDWTTTYPTGTGLPGGFYIQYHSYNYIWPLLALAHYIKITTGKES